MMTRLIGKKRIAILTVLALVNAVLAASLFLYIEPMREKAAMRRQTVDREIRDLRSSISNIKTKIKSLEENQEAYDALKERGFFVVQDRFLAEKTLDGMRSWANLIGFSFSISPIKEIPNVAAEGIKYKVIQSRVVLERIRAYTDSDIYLFIQQISKKFPGQAQLVSVTFNRGAALDEKNLSKLVTDLRELRPPTISFVDAKIAFNWQTMLPADDGTNSATGGF